MSDRRVQARGSLAPGGITRGCRFHWAGICNGVCGAAAGGYAAPKAWHRLQESQTRTGCE